MGAGPSVAETRIELDELALPLKCGGILRLLVVLDQRAAQLGLFDLRGDTIIEICLLLWVVEMVGDGMRAVVAKVVEVLARDGVDPVTVQLAAGHCGETWGSVGGIYGLEV